MSGLPPGWVEAPISEIADKIGSGATPKGGHVSYQESGIPLIRSQNVHFSGFSDEGLAHLDDAQAAKLDGVKVSAGDVLLNITGASIGRVTTAPARMEGARVNQHVAIVRPAMGLDSRFVARFLATQEVQQFIVAENYGVTRQALTKSMIEGIRLKIPPLPEQRRIVAKLDALDARAKRARADLDRIPALVARAKQAILAKAFRGELTRDWRQEAEDERHLPDAFDDLRLQREKYHASRRGVRLKDLPPLKSSLNGLESWIGCCLADVCELRLGYAFKSDWFSNVGPRLLRGANIAPGKVDWTDEKRISIDRAGEYSEYFLKAGDIVIAMDRPVISTGIKVARISADDDGALLVQRVASPICGELLNAAYAWLLFDSYLFRAVIDRESTGSDLPHISGNDILGMEIPLPSVAEQAEIVRRIESAFAKIDRIAADAASASKLLTRLDQAILTKAFRGELVPQDPNDEPAEVLLARIRGSSTAQPTRRRRARNEIVSAT